MKDVMVRLDGTSGDDARLATTNQIAEIFDSHITGLIFNVLLARIADGFDGIDAKRLRAAKEAGDAPETMVFQRLTRLPIPPCRWRAPATLRGDWVERPSQRTGKPDRKSSVRTTGRA
jgi:hypothetical protein